MRWTGFVGVLLFLLPPVLLARLSDDWFQLLDLNHDGTLDKTEYEQGLEKFQAFLKHPLPESAVVSWWSSSSSSSSWSTMKGFWKAFTSSVMMIIATEIGDKTFFIAAVLSMKYDRWAVFGGAMVALIIMTILSTALGLLLPTVLPRQYTHILGGVLFLYFGIKLLLESRKLEAGKSSDELEEVEEELMRGSGKKQDEEEGGYALQEKKKFWYQIMLQALTLTFLAEWGDRSQIATIALAAAKNPIGVTIGGCLGHSMCTGMAVLGGRMLASSISEKTVHQFGGAIFLLFGLHSIFLEE